MEMAEANNRMQLNARALELFVKAGKIRGLHLVAGVWVSLSRRQIAVKDQGAVAGAFDCKGLSRGADERDLGTVERIAHLIDFDGQGWVFGPMGQNERADEKGGKVGQKQQLPAGP